MNRSLRAFGFAVVLAGCTDGATLPRAVPPDQASYDLVGADVRGDEVLLHFEGLPDRWWVPVGLWRDLAPADTLALGMLFNSTRDFNDRRVVDAVAEVARRPAAPDVTRVYALALLFNYAVPGTYLDVSDLMNPRKLGPGMSWSTHDDRAYATRGILGDLRPYVGQVLRSVLEAEPGTRVGNAAATILRVMSELPD